MELGPIPVPDEQMADYHVVEWARRERSTRMSLLISVPGMIHAGARCEQPVSLMDLYSTLVDLTGFEKPFHLDGE